MATNRWRTLSVLAVLAVLFALVPAMAASAATLTVNNTGDAVDANTGDGFCDAVGGGCTLRAAIQQANALPGVDTIQFLIDTGPQTISPASALPAITEPAVLDATTQPGWVDKPVITINGAIAGAAASGLTVQAGSTTIRGFAIGGFAGARGIWLLDAGGNVIEANHLGTNAAGTARHANGLGILISAGSTGNTIGGTGTIRDTGVPVGNLIAGNTGTGITINTTGNVVTGNRIGGVGATTPTNDSHGIAVQSASNNIIGGTTAAARNVISGNLGSGVLINGATSTGNIVLGNYIGASQSGTSVHLNGGSGVSITDASNNTVGGTSAAARNVITGNSQHGVNITGLAATNNKVQGNYIGTNAAGGSTFDTSWTRATTGVRIDGASSTLIGGTAAGAGNVISLNATGISLWGTGGGTQSNRIEGNRIGTDPAGLVDQGNTGAGVSVFAAPNNFVGGTVPGAGNVISGNGNTNVFVEGAGATGNRIQGNIIGLNADGTAALTNPSGPSANGYGGISVRTADTMIGGTVAAARNIISGHPQHGIEVGAPDVTVQGNYIGTDSSGTSAFGNGQGVRVLTVFGSAPTGSLVGGSSPAARNVIAANSGAGVEFAQGASGATVSGNYIGLSATGAPLGNNTGVSMFGAGANTIGGDGPGEGNVIAASSQYDAFLGDVTGAVIQGNLIGTNPAGTASVDSGVYGIFAGNGTSNAQIGGTTPGAGNVIAGAQVGIGMQGTGSGNVVQGNFVGTDRTATLDLGNSERGLMVAMNGTQIGGTAAGAGNVVAHNDGAGIFLWNGTTGMAVRANSIFDNGTVAVPELGIDNGTSSVRPEANDAGDGDSGTNLRQNYPVLTGATSTAGVTTVSGTLNSVANKTYAIDVFATPACDVMGYGEGQQFLGSLSASTDGTGNATFSGPVAGYAPGGWAVTTTATDPAGNTSEFSTCQTASGAPGASIDDVSVVEGNAGTINAVFTVTLTGEAGQEVNLNYTTSNGTATAPGDYTATSGTLAFGPTETTKTISVPVQGDTASELDETFTVVVSGGSGAGIVDGVGTGTIVSDDPPTITVDDVAVPEGNSGPSAGAFTLTMSRPVEQEVTVNFATSHGTATSADYTSTTGTATFEPGETTTLVELYAVGDTLDENDETFLLSLSSPSGGVIADGVGVATITDDDPEPTLVINNATVTEGNTGTTNATFTISASAPSGKPISVDVATADNNATQPADYTAVSTTASIPAGQTTATVNVPVVGDTVDEASTETFHVNLSNATNATIQDAQGVGSITDDDNPPTLSISDESVTEGDSGTQTMTFDVTLSAASGSTVLVNYNTSAVTATAGTDYVTTSGTLTFTAGQTTKTIDVTINGDAVDESNETFNLNLGAPTNASISDGLGVGTIIDNDAPLTVSIADNTIAEQTGELSFTLELSRTYPQSVSVSYGTTNVSAAAGQDYTGESGTVTFTAGTTQQQINIAILDDNVFEGNETFQVNLNTPTGGVTIGDGQAIGTITDAADVPAVSIADDSATEGAPNVPFTVTLNRASTTTVTVLATTSNGTALAGSDYVAKSAQVTFTPGSTSQLFAVVPIDDASDEPSEAFGVTLSSPSSNATIGDGSAIGTLTDNDAAPTVSVADSSKTEADTVSGVMPFAVTLSEASGHEVTVDYATVGGTAGANGDFTGISGQLTFAPGDDQKVVNVPVLDDGFDEADETFSLQLSDPGNATLGTAIATGTILDDDDEPSISIGNVSVQEGNTGTTQAVLTVTLSEGSARTVTVDYATTGDDGDTETPVAGTGDFTAETGTVTFNPGEQTQEIHIAVSGDTAPELDETFAVTLDNPVFATISDPAAVVTITDDDTPQVGIADTEVSEADGAQAQFTVTLSEAHGKPVTVDWATDAEERTATSDDDFTASSGQVQFAPGDTQETITVPVLDDAVEERPETFVVSLSNATNAVISSGLAVGTITDAADQPAASIANVTVAEDVLSGAATFTVTLNRATVYGVDADFTVTEGTALHPQDYTVASGSLAIPAGQTQTTISVPVVDDPNREQAETFTVTLTNPMHASLADGTAVGTITNDDARPRLAIGDVTVTELDTEAVVATIPVTLSARTFEPVSVDFATVAGTATAPADFAAKAGALSFPPGALRRTITVRIAGDLSDEPNEQLTVALSNAVNAGVLDGSGRVTILDDDPPPALAILDRTITEGNTGSKLMGFTIRLSTISGKPVTVTWTTADATAKAPGDYAAAQGQVTIPAGVRSKVVNVTVIGDTVVEGNETFSVALSSPVRATIADRTARGTILNND